MPKCTCACFSASTAVVSLLHAVFSTFKRNIQLASTLCKSCSTLKIALIRKSVEFQQIPVTAD